jgi:hypothetical protein
MASMQSCPNATTDPLITDPLITDPLFKPPLAAGGTLCLFLLEKYD